MGSCVLTDFRDHTHILNTKIRCGLHNLNKTNKYELKQRKKKNRFPSKHTLLWSVKLNRSPNYKINSHGANMYMPRHDDPDLNRVITCLHAPITPTEHMNSRKLL